MKLKYVYLLILILTTSIFSQRLLKISVSNGAEKEVLPYLVKNGITYVSTKELSKILSGNYFYNPSAQKVEMKFDNYNLKVTAKNQFFVISSKSNYEQDVYQIPISTQLIKDDIFIPIVYSLKYVELAYQKKLLYNDKDKNLIITSKPNDLFESIDTEKTSSPISVSKKKIIDSKYDIYGIEISEMTNGTLIRIGTTKKINMFRSSVLDGKLFFFVSGASIDPDFQKNFKPAGVVKKVNVKNVKGNKQIEFTLNNEKAISDSIHSSYKDIDSDDILITIQNDVFDKFTKDISVEKAKWNFDVLIIDAGHGGKDPGAIGITGVKEKDVNLKIALELEKIIKEKMDGIKVVLTRDDDSFVELFKRGKIANENEGKLFISIHANSVGKKNKNARGFDVYLLRPGKTEKAIEIAEIENSVIKYEDDAERYQKLTNENFILVSMAHSAYMRYSEKFAGILSQNWSTGVKEIPSRGVKQAGFYVLVGASMPSVLVETGFLSNRADEAYLNSKNGQREIAKSIFKSIEDYRKYYNEQMKEDE
ncbi:MAG: N-acetylmuramoyl-L-alanine amidase [Bacteroidetes bacterium]|nr:N-acetylmuramoyl-L-alanine amidase [Bacteroidota bacterium]MBU1116762.1 N-acetylmuramoyl-L-alanine amidase [Bacteroidota bacterium]MBU1798849.1 N-acetylmuramoyl-L-alanine amidase [Bacteroidota bacterium]